MTAAIAFPVLKNDIAEKLSEVCHITVGRLPPSSICNGYCAIRREIMFRWLKHNIVESKWLPFLKTYPQTMAIVAAEYES